MDTIEQIKEYLDSLPGVLALFWFMENVSDEHPHRTELFFYCRERVRRYALTTPTHSSVHWKHELKWDTQMFERLEREA
jgi:hypothetical protein